MTTSREQETRTSTGDMIAPDWEKSRALEALGLVNPLGQTEAQWSQAESLRDLKSTTIGFLDNRFPHADALLDLVRHQLENQYELKGTLTIHKFLHSRQAAPEEIEKLARDCDLVVTGVGG